MKKYNVWITFFYENDRYEVKTPVRAENRAQAEWITENKLRDDPALVSVQVQVRDSEE